MSRRLLLMGVGLVLGVGPMGAAVVAFQPQLPLSYLQGGGSPDLGFGVPGQPGFYILTSEGRQSGSGFDLDGNGTADFKIYGTISGPAYYGLVEAHNRNQIWSRAGGFAGNDFGTDALALVGGTSIGPTLSSSNLWVGWHNDDDTRASSVVGLVVPSPYYAEGDFVTRPADDPRQGYLMGVRFERDGALHYGWVEMTYRGFFGVWVNRWAYESEPDTAIVAGAIPEPSTTLLAFGLLLLIARRRRCVASAE